MRGVYAPLHFHMMHVMLSLNKKVEGGGRWGGSHNECRISSEGGLLCKENYSGLWQRKNEKIQAVEIKASAEMTSTLEIHFHSVCVCVCWAGLQRAQGL